MEIYWIGIRESEVKYTNFIKNSITIFGNNNISMQQKYKKVIDHNNINNFTMIDDFFNTEVKKLINTNQDVRFMYYSQIDSYRSMEQLGLTNYIICSNNQELIETLSDKFKLKKYFKAYVPVLNYKLIKGINCKLSKIKKMFNTTIEDFVIQTAKGSGGSGTLIINKENKDILDISNEQVYMVTEYCKKNIPVNIHVLVSDNEIQLLPPSIQIIEICNNKLVYKGCDYIAYRKEVSDKLNKKLELYSTIIAKHLQKMGYRGICGIDNIIYNNEIYLMEINTRFQNSSTILNKALQESNLPSLQELHYNCFYNKIIKLPRFAVNYSCYIKESGIKNKKFKIKAIEELDVINENVLKEEMCYLGTSIFNKSIY